MKQRAQFAQADAEPGGQQVRPAANQELVGTERTKAKKVEGQSTSQKRVSA